MGRLSALQHSVREVERQRQRRSLPLRRWFNHRLHGGAAVSRNMLQRLAAHIPHSQADAIAATYVLEMTQHGMDTLSMAMAEHGNTGWVGPLREWWDRNSAHPPSRGPIIPRGFWRGDMNARLVEPDACIIRVAADGNCFYRSVGVAMALHFPGQLQQALARLVQTPKLYAPADVEGLSMRYPPSADLAEQQEWNAEHRALLEKVTAESRSILSWLDARLDGALVRAMRELTARQLEQAADLQQLAMHDIAFHANDQLNEPSRKAGRTYGNAIATPGDYVKYVVRQMWEDSMSTCYLALGQAIGVPIHIYTDKPPCKSHAQGHGVNLYHHGLHFDIVSLLAPTTL